MDNEEALKGDPAVLKGDGNRLSGNDKALECDEEALTLIPAVYSGRSYMYTRPEPSILGSHTCAFFYIGYIVILHHVRPR